MLFLIIITFILEFLILYFVPSYFHHLNLFYPMLTLTLIVFLDNKVNPNKYLKIVFWIGFFYDLFFSYIFLFHSLVFLMFGKIMKKIDKYFKKNLLIDVVFLIVFIFFYDFILYILVLLSNYNLVTLSDFLYKFQNSLLLNIGFLLLLTLIFHNKEMDNFILLASVKKSYYNKDKENRYGKNRNRFR